MFNLIGGNIQLDRFDPGLRPHDRRQLFDHLRHPQTHPVQRYLRTFNLAHIEDVVDQAQQMLGRIGDFF